MKILLLFLIFVFIAGCHTACPRKWKPFGKSCYRKFLELLPWKKAKRSCKKHKAQLAKIESAEENDFLVKKFLKMRPRHFYSNAWIGLNDLKEEGTYRWTDGTKPKYLNWGPDQPNDEYHAQDCTFLGKGVFEFGGANFTGSWVDVQCYWYLKYLCEKPQKSKRFFKNVTFPREAL